MRVDAKNKRRTDGVVWRLVAALRYWDVPLPIPNDRGPLLDRPHYSGFEGVKVNHAVGVDIAARNGCRFVQSKGLKPIRYVAGKLGISDGSGLGWTAPELYILYLNGAAGGSH